MTAMHDRQADAGDRAEHRNADEADDRQPELPALDAEDAAQVGELEQADGRGDHDRRQRAVGQVLAADSAPAAAAAPPPRRRPRRSAASCAPAASATGVRDELLLIGNPWNSPAARLAAPRPTISWFGSTWVRVFAA